MADAEPTDDEPEKPTKLTVIAPPSATMVVPAMGTFSVRYAGYGRAVVDVKELLPIIFERSNASITLWNIEFAVILGMITVIAKELANHWLVKLSLSILFLSVQFVNARALIEVSLHRKILLDIFAKTRDNVVVQRFMDDSYIIAPLRFSSPGVIITVFVLVSIIFVSFIWIYPYFTSLHMPRKTGNSI